MIRHFLTKMVTPIIKELPIILVFFFIIKTSIIEQVTILGLDNWEELVVTLSLWFLYAYVIAATICIVNKTWLRFLGYFFLYSVYAVAYFIGSNFEMRISPTLFTLLFETNGRESSEFLDAYAFCSKSIGVYVKLSIYASITVIMEFVYRRYIFPQIRFTRIGMGAYVISFVVIGVLCTGIYGCTRFIDYFRLNTTNGTDLLEYPADDIYTRLFCSLYFSYHSSDDIEKAIDASLRSADATTIIDESDSLKIIFVIGESYNKMHASLYGYSLQTTPNLQELKEKGNLYVFSDVVTPYNFTSMSLKNMLSCNSLMDSEKWYDYPFFPLLFRKAGYDVFFWDNQRDFFSDTNWQYAVNSYLYNHKLSEKAYSKNNKIDYQYDEQLVDDFHEFYNSSPQSNSLVLFHLKGQHVGYGLRYPQTKKFVKFTPDDIHRTDDYLDTVKKQIIANYDNATYYNDYVLSQIIDLFSNDNAILVYLSDHGEEIYDYRDFRGRSYTGTVTPQYLKCQFDIPCMIWCSDKYMVKYPETKKSIQESVNKPFMIDNVCHLFFHVGRIRTKYYQSDRDVLSPQYIIKDRWIRGGESNYDQIKRQNTF
jgi:heptose-I-phosphate ethanolaminephosphotransferase